MSTSGFHARPYLGWLVAGAVLIASFLGYRHLTGPAASESKRITVLDPRGQPSGVFGRRGAPDSHMMALYDPDTHPTVSRDELVPLRMAPRLDSLDNKTIYLVDTGFAGGKEFLEEMQAWFKRNMPYVKTVLRIKSGTPYSDSPELWAEIKKNADGVVFGVGG
ncbi:MAG: hypothetical protein GXX84_00620 [Acidobacteria bacterium]|nr:hypothetical protein [Acidobacteriota bacterium]